MSRRMVTIEIDPEHANRIEIRSTMVRGPERRTSLLTIEDSYGGVMLLTSDTHADSTSHHAVTSRAVMQLIAAWVDSL